jgi:hypothetical protein
MSFEALLIILMAGSEIFRPLRGVLHQGMVGQPAVTAVHALMEAKSTAPAGGSQVPNLAPSITFDASPIRASAATPMPGSASTFDRTTSLATSSMSATTSWMTGARSVSSSAHPSSALSTPRAYRRPAS